MSDCLNTFAISAKYILIFMYIFKFVWNFTNIITVMEPRNDANGLKYFA